MKARLVSLLLAAAIAAQAAPVLVAVDLPDGASRQHWVDLHYPTYAYAEPTVFAEVDEGDIATLSRHGLSARVLDRTPWRGQYYLGEVPGGVRARLPGDVLWERGETVLVRVPVDAVAALRSLPARFHPVTRRAMGPRFWHQFLTPTVPLRSLPWDPMIQAVVDEVSTDSLTAYIQRLQDFGSRLILGDSSYASSQWIFDTFASWGYQARFDSFYISEAVMGDWPGIGWERNVIARKAGTSGSDVRHVIGGHFDSIVWSDTALARIDAPGADDNATGIAGAMEAARVLRDFPMEKDVDFAGWGAEEIGLIGSVVYAFTADQQGDAIEGMINMDMIGYMDDSRLDCIIQYAASPTYWFADLYRQAAQTYVPSLTVTPTIASGGSDWYPFAYVGYPAVGAAEQDRTNFNPHYHDPSDRIETLTPELYTAITKASLATLVILGVCPGPVYDVTAQDMGDGETVMVSWSPSGEPDIDGYWVWWGTASQTYADSALINGAASASYGLGGLTVDTPYYLVVRAMDTDGHQSYRATEVVAVPRLVPQAPAGAAATPIAGGIRVDWFPNGEADVVGYRVHRRVNQGEYALLADGLSDTTLVDPGLSGANRYYYRIDAVDAAGNISAPSAEAYGRPLTLDQGILVVDETRNYTAQPDSVQDAFYRSALQGFIYTEYEYGTAAEAPTASDLAPYSTVVWHADDFAQFLAANQTPALRDYLDAGGNLWFVGWKPSADLTGSTVYPMTFEAGSFMYDCMGVARVELSGMSDSLVGITGDAGYPDLAVDTATIPTPAWGQTLRYVESWQPAPSAEAIYRADMTNDGSAFDGAICGVARLNAGPRVVFFGFPLSFMEADGARQAARAVLTALGEPLSAGDAPPLPSTLSVIASPNPFATSTTITFAVRQAGTARVAVFDMAGRVVIELLDRPVTTGIHELAWDGTNQAGNSVGSGTYLCTLDMPGTHAVTVLLLVR